MHSFRRAATALAITAIAALALVPSFFAGEAEPSAMLGQSIGDISLPDYTGKQVSLTDFKDSKGVVLIFVSTKCPVSNAYNERMTALAGEYQKKGIQFLGINSNKAELPEEMSKHAADNKWNFPVLKDDGNKIADKLKASVTPEVFLVDGKGILRYHGRIDDSQDPAAIKSQDLRNALDALLSGGEVSKKEAKAFGCSIKRA